jgi:type VI secretion system secreted protein VgrG
MSTTRIHHQHRSEEPTMKRTGSRRAPSVIAASTSVVALAVVGALVAIGSDATAAPVAVGLGTASSFAVLAGTGVTNTGPTTITGDIGAFPTATITGLTSITVSGTNHAGDSVTQGAKTDLTTAYVTAAGEGPTTAIAADLVGRTLKPGVYNSASAVGLSGVLTLDAAGDPNAVWVFQAGSTLITASGSKVVMLNGAQSCHVYWQVGSSATLGTNSTFTGTILALTDISVQTGATVDGRVLARNGAVTLDSNTITRSACSSATTAPSATATSTPTPQVTATPSGPVGTGDNSTG